MEILKLEIIGQKLTNRRQVMVSTYLDKKVITSEIVDRVMGVKSKYIMDTNEEFVQQALIRLGWIPPQEMFDNA